MTGWPRLGRNGGALAGAVFLGLLVVGGASCGGDGGDGAPSVGQVIERVLDAVQEPGMVYHAEGDDQSAVWLDGERDLFRRREAAARGAATTVGSGWTRYAYDSTTNQITEEDVHPEEGVESRIDDPIAHWFEPLNVLAFGANLRVIGQTVADGKAVIAVESRTPILKDGEETGRFLVSRLEFSADTYLPHAFERYVALPEGETPAADGSEDRVRVLLTVSELIPADSLAEGFFDRAVLEDLIKSIEKAIEETRSYGLTPWWLDEEHASDFGFLGLPDLASWSTDPQTGVTSIRYALVIPVDEEGNAVQREEAVVIRLAPSLADLKQPTVPAFAGNLPERSEELTVRGQPATLYTSLLTPDSLPCPQEDCPSNRDPLYRRLTFQLGETAVQIEAMAKLDTRGTDANLYNSREGLLHLAEALTEATAE